MASYVSLWSSLYVYLDRHPISSYISRASILCVYISSYKSRKNILYIYMYHLTYLEREHPLSLTLSLPICIYREGASRTQLEQPSLQHPPPAHEPPAQLPPEEEQGQSLHPDTSCAGAAHSCGQFSFGKAVLVSNTRHRAVGSRFLIKCHC